MTAAREPWWSSGVGPDDPPVEDDPVDAHRAARRGDGGVDDPVDAHRAARRGDRRAGDPLGDDDSAADDGEDHTGSADEGASGGSPHEDAAGHDPDICGVCPICVGARLLGETRPELVAHLTEATRHLAAAVRTLLDEQERERPPGSPPDDRVTRIDLD